MACEHLSKLNKFIKDNEMELSSYDLIKVVCKKCRIKYECETIPVRMKE